MIEYPIRILAILGAAVIGALGTHFAISMFARLTLTRQKLPVWMLRMLRLLGAAALGSAAAFWLFGGGQGGFGGSGGSGIGPGSGTGIGTTSLVSPNTGKEDVDKPGSPPIVPAESLQIEVLSREAAQRISGQSAGFDPERRYRTDFGKGPELLTFEELKRLLLNRQTEDPPLRQVSLVLYRDTPDRRLPAVADLSRWLEQDLPASAKGEKILVNIDARGQNAPPK